MEVFHVNSFYSRRTHDWGRYVRPQTDRHVYRDTNTSFYVIHAVLSHPGPFIFRLLPYLPKSSTMHWRQSDQTLWASKFNPFKLFPSLHLIFCCHHCLDPPLSGRGTGLEWRALYLRHSDANPRPNSLSEFFANPNKKSCWQLFSFSVKLSVTV